MIELFQCGLRLFPDFSLGVFDSVASDGFQVNSSSHKERKGRAIVFRLNPVLTWRRAQVEVALVAAPRSHFFSKRLVKIQRSTWMPV